MSNVTLTPFLAAQVIGFPIAFLVRCATRLWRVRRASVDDVLGIRLEAGANLCFALMSIAFAFVRPLGVLFLLGGLVLLFAAKLPKLRRRPEVVPTSPSIRNSKLARRKLPA